MIYAINCPHFIVWLPLLREISDNKCIAIVNYPVCDVISFEIYLCFLIQPFSYMTKNSEQKNEISKERKELFRSNKKHFSSF